MAATSRAPVRPWRKVRARGKNVSACRGRRARMNAPSRAVGSTVLTHEGGLHARPSIWLSKVATRFSGKGVDRASRRWSMECAKDRASGNGPEDSGQTMMIFDHSRRAPMLAMR